MSPPTRKAGRLAAAIAALVLSVGLAGCGSHSSATAVAPSGCSLYASPGGSDVNAGTLSSPFLTAQKLVSSLTAGQTGCLRQGSYSQSEVTFTGSDVTLSSYPGETGTLRDGFIYVPSGSNNVTIEDLHIDASSTSQVGVQLMSSGDALTRDDITNGSAHDSCIILGSNVGWGQAVNTTIANNVIHQCGNTADGNQDHAIYADNSVNATIDNNVIWGAAAYAIHLYENSQGSQITHNVIVGNGYGVIFAGSPTLASDNNVVADNIIAGSTAGPDVSSYWGGPVGTGNVLQGNCIVAGAGGGVQSRAIGFAASGNVTASPGFVNAAAENYRLRAGSPCLPVVGYDTVAAVEGTSGNVPITPLPTPPPPPPTPVPPSPAPTPAPPAISQLTVTGTPKVGAKLTANAPSSSTVAWVKCRNTTDACAVIPGATSSTYTISASMAGLYLRAEAIGTSGGLGISSPTSKIGK
jgi:hypothetical protein